MGLFKSLTNLAEDVVGIVVAPVEIAVDMTRVVTKPIADVAKEVTKETKEMVNEITEEDKGS